MKFFKGLAKGFGYLLLLAVVSFFIPTNLVNSFIFMIWILSVSMVIYLRSRYKFPYAWVVVSLFAGALLVPFMMGAIEASKGQK